MATRSLLAINKLDDFKEWLKEDGWIIQEPKGFYEVVRAKKDKRLLIIHQKMMADVHTTVWNKDEKLIRAYIKERRSKNEN